ncbi:hypothetical protein G7046_g7721 [Stylonectria norvegica]|nr:hypothetical protein G7046_g7721 [Stylonectria norvegica]
MAFRPPSQDPDVRPHFQTAWQVQHAAGEPAAVIRVRNLQATIQGPHDAWGRPGRPQPVLISAEVTLSQPFGDSSSADAVAPDTVHYGLLSKAILGALKRLEEKAEAGNHTPASLLVVLDTVWEGLTGLSVRSYTFRSESSAFLNVSAIKHLLVTVDLPKASLLGSSVSFTASAAFGDTSGRKFGTQVQTRSLVLNLNGLRVPTLIGVNDNERKAKQIVVANIGIEGYHFLFPDDVYSQLENSIVDVMEMSSFETLEALAAEMSKQITHYLRKHRRDLISSNSEWQIKIALEKPTAVPLADAACVELRTDTDGKWLL